MHDPTKVVLGATQSSAKDIQCFNSDPATFLAGLVVSLGSDSGLSLLKSAGYKVGVSLGKSLSDHKKTSVCVAGLSVPILAHLKRASAIFTVTDYTHLLSGGGADTVAIASVTFTAQSGAVTSGQATFRAATDNATTAASLAAQINAHATTAALVYAVASGAAVTVYSKVDGVGSTGTGNDIIAAYNNLHDQPGIVVTGSSGGKLAGGSNTITDIDYVAVGAKAYVNDTTGKLDVAMTGFSTITDAIYISTEKTGIAEDNSEVACALVDMTGGL